MMNMKKIREQAHKDLKAMKSNAKEQAKAAKKAAAHAADDVTAANEAMSKMGEEIKDSVLHAAHTAKTDIKEMAANAAVDIAAAKDAVTKKADDVKDSLVHAAQAVKIDTKAGFKKADQIDQNISKGFGEVVSDGKRAGHAIADTVKRH